MKTIGIVLLLLLCCAGSAGSQSSAAVTTFNLDNVLYVDGVKYACSDVGLTAAIAAAPSTGAQIVFNCGTTATFASTVTIDKPIFLLIGSTTITGPTSGYIFDVESNGVHIEGLGQGSSTVLRSGSNTHAIYAGPGKINWKIAHLQINSTNVSRTAGAGFYADSAMSPAANQIGIVDDVTIYDMYQGINLQRPINTIVSNTAVTSAQQDGFVFNGDGTTVTCLNCASYSAAGRGAHVTWMNGVQFIGGEFTDGAGESGISLDSNGTNATMNTSLVGVDFEDNAIGLLTDDAAFVSVVSSNFSDNRGDAIRFKGGSGLSVISTMIRNNPGYGVNLGVSSTLGNHASDATISSTYSWVNNADGNLRDPNVVATTLNNQGAMQVARSLILSGSTSGTITHKAPPIAGANIITDPAATGTTSLAQVEYCGATTGATHACAKTLEILPVILYGDVLLNSATSQSITALPFTASTYSCTGSDLTTATGVVSFNTYAKSSVTIAESGGTNTDHLRYVCVGY